MKMPAIPFQVTSNACINVSKASFEKIPYERIPSIVTPLSLDKGQDETARYHTANLSGEVGAGRMH